MGNGLSEKDWGNTMPTLAKLLGASVAGLPRVMFQGVEYVLAGDMESGGAISTREQYENGACSFAHLFPDGRILRFGDQIGTRADLELLGTSEPGNAA